MVSTNVHNDFASVKNGTAILRLPDDEFLDRRNLVLSRLKTLEANVDLLVEHMPSSEIEFKELPPVVDGFLKYRYIEIFGQIYFISSHFGALSGLRVPRRTKPIFWLLAEIGAIDASVAQILCNTLVKYRVRLAHGRLGPDHHLFDRLELLIDVADDFIVEIRNAVEDDFFSDLWRRLESEGLKLKTFKAFPRCGIWGAVKETGYWLGRVFAEIYHAVEDVNARMRVTRGI